MKLKNYILASTHHLFGITVRQVAALFVGSAALFVGCIDEIPEQSEREVSFCVRTAWQDGLRSSTTRALPDLTDSEGGEDIVIDPEDYPETINVHCSDGKDFTLTKGSGLCTTHTDEKYWNYTPSKIYKIRQIENENLTFTATATIDNAPELALGDELEGEATKDDMHDSHLRITLHHTKALLRFAFQEAKKYDSIRYVKITEIQLNGNQCHLADKVLTTDYQVIAYAYIDPNVVTTSSMNTLKCTYDVYDKDPNSTSPDQINDAHITRSNVVTQNSFKLSALKDFKDLSDPKDLKDPIVLTPGFYYDLLITLDPDYLYTLSDHDEPTDLILH